MNDQKVNIASDERIDEVNEKIRLIQKKGGLTFGTDAYMLAAFIRPEPRSRGAELGSGSGIVSLLCAARGKLAQIHALEIQPPLAELGERNITLNSFDDKIIQHLTDIRSVKPNDLCGEVDVVFSNPPYMRSGHGKRCELDIKNIARHEEEGDIYDFCAAAARLLRYGGKFYTVWRPDRLPDLIDAMRQHRLEPKRMTFIHPDTDTPPAIVLTEARLGGSPSLNITAPLILYRDPPAVTPRTLTDRALQVYETCSL